jgi:hypothetical protein
MSFDYDGFSKIKPATGNVAQSDGTYRAVTFIATLAAPIAYSASSWTMEEKGTAAEAWVAAPSNTIVTLKPASGSSSVFHCSYIGKKSFARATFVGGAATYTTVYSMPTDAPVFAETIAGVEDGVMSLT